MNDKNVTSMIAIVRQNNGMLNILDKYKDDTNITLKEILSEFEKQYKINLKEHYFFNQYQIITSFLAYIVIPKETFYDTLPKYMISTLDNGWGLNLKKNKDMSIQYFIRHLRNAIAHGNINFNEDLEFTFEDLDGTIIYFDASEILSFVQALAYWSIKKDITLRDLK